MWREQIIHDHKMHLSSERDFDAMQAIELREERVWIFPDVVVVFPEHVAEDLVFGVMDGFDDVFVVA